MLAAVVCGTHCIIYGSSETQKCSRFLKYIDKSSLCRSRFLKFAFIVKWHLSEYKNVNYCLKIDWLFGCKKKTKI